MPYKHARALALTIPYLQALGGYQNQRYDRQWVDARLQAEAENIMRPENALSAKETRIRSVERWLLEKVEKHLDDLYGQMQQHLVKQLIECVRRSHLSDDQRQLVIFSVENRYQLDGDGKKKVITRYKNWYQQQNYEDPVVDTRHAPPIRTDFGMDVAGQRAYMDAKWDYEKRVDQALYQKIKRAKQKARDQASYNPADWVTVESLKDLLE